MGNLSDHFSRKEFECSCGCGKDTVDARLLYALEMLRVWAEAPVKINSGNRCFRQNIMVGGGDGSQHKLSKAADVEVEGKTPKQVYNFLDACFYTELGLGLYTHFTHVDSRTRRTRWNITTLPEHLRNGGSDTPPTTQ